MVTGFSGAQSPNLSFQCSRSLAITSRTLSFVLSTSVLRKPVTNGYRQWRFVVSVRLGFKRMLPDMAR
jgi:hypothetical protein